MSRIWRNSRQRRKRRKRVGDLLPIDYDDVGIVGNVITTFIGSSRRLTAG